MSERWKYQIKNGGFYALSMTLIVTLWDIYATSFEEAFLSKRFIIRFAIFLLTGILIGYFNWKAKAKENNS